MFLSVCIIFVSVYTTKLSHRHQIYDLKKTQSEHALQYGEMVTCKAHIYIIVSLRYKETHLFSIWSKARLLSTFLTALTCFLMIFYLDFPAWLLLKSHHVIGPDHILESHPVVISSTSDYTQWLIPIYIKGEKECKPAILNEIINGIINNTNYYYNVICFSTDLLWFSLNSVTKYCHQSPCPSNHFPIACPSRKCCTIITIYRCSLHFQ